MGYWIIQVVELFAIPLLIAAVVAIDKDRSRLRGKNEQLKRSLEQEKELTNYAQELARRFREESMDAQDEAERARKECSMHEKERRQLEAKILHMKEEYEAQAARADELMQREMANFLGYNGTERGQKELNDGADE